MRKSIANLGLRVAKGGRRLIARGPISLLLLLLILYSGFSTLYSSPQTTLSVDVNLVSVFTTVQNERGEFVSGLKAEDFRVYDDGVEQKISIFETDDKVESAVAILLDSSGSMVDILPLMKRGTQEFVRLSPRSDDLCVMAFGIAPQLLMDFNGTASDLGRRLNDLRARGTSVFFDALLDGMKRVSPRKQSRKAIIAFTDGNDNGSAAGFKEVSNAAQRSGVLLYFVAIGAKVLIDQHTLEDLASLSGGRVIYLATTDAVPPAIAAIRAELSKQYYLGYYATRLPGSHAIRVEIPGRSVRIRAKSGYSG